MTRPGLDQQRIVVARKHAGQVAPAGRRITQAKTRGDLTSQASPLEVVDRARRGLQRGLVVVAGARQNFAQGLPLLALLGCAGALLRARIALGNRDAGTLRQLAHGVHERQPLVLHQEADRVAMRAAAEAVIRLPARADREARRLLAVERAQALVHGARALELDMAADDLHDVDAGQQLLDEADGQHGISLAAARVAGDGCVRDASSARAARSPAPPR